MVAEALTRPVGFVLGGGCPLLPAHPAGPLNPMKAPLRGRAPSPCRGASTTV